MGKASRNKRERKLIEGLPPGYRNAVAPQHPQGPLTEFHSPCDCVMHYPTVLAQLAQQQRVAHALPVMCDHHTGFIVTTEPDGLHFRISGDPGTVMEIYRDIPWPEDVLDFEGAYPSGHSCKRAPSPVALRDYFDQL